MSRVSTLPYLTPRHERITVHSWQLNVGGQPRSFGDYLRGWDPSLSLQIRCTLQTDLQGILADCELPSDAEVGCCLVWSSTTTTIKVCGPVIAAGYDPINLSVEVEGALAGGELRIGAHAALIRSVSGIEPPAPSRAGAILWWSDRTLQLEGNAGRFPVEWTDFSQSHLFHQDSAWYLDWDPKDLNKPTLGAVRLYLNSKHEAIRRAIEAAQPDDAQRVILESIRYDVGRTLIVEALRNTEFVDPDFEFDQETLGDTLHTLLSALYPRLNIRHLHERALSERGSLESELQGRLAFLGAIRQGE